VLDLNNHGIKDTAALLGGWNSWKAAGLPTEGSSAPKKK
jgi:3-mercaptopyruvate sulfurtransferase SseA